MVVTPRGFSELTVGSKPTYNVYVPLTASLGFEITQISNVLMSIEEPSAAVWSLSSYDFEGSYES